MRLFYEKKCIFAQIHRFFFNEFPKMHVFSRKKDAFSLRPIGFSLMNSEKAREVLNFERKNLLWMAHGLGLLWSTVRPWCAHGHSWSLMVRSWCDRGSTLGAAWAAYGLPGRSTDGSGRSQAPLSAPCSLEKAL